MRVVRGLGVLALLASVARFLPAQDTVAASLVRAVRTARPIVVDGREDDAVWARITPTAGFRQYFPREDGKPTVETEFKVAYDDQSLYVFVRAFDPHPDSIMRAVTRRDTNSPSDIVGLTIDGYHDRRTGYEFAINPDGVKKDCAVYADTLFDWFWDGVWDAAARVDSAGWTAEFRIPFSQIRYADVREHVFGLAVWRTSYRYSESSIWPLWRTSRGGLIHQLADLVGVDDIVPPHALMVAPYTVASNASRQTAAGYGRAQHASVGGDVKYNLASNFTLNATINPDFGQVEADPSVLNLTTAETFYPEQRPFFREGAGLYEFDLGCNGSACAGEGLFYSRRIGRAPQLASSYGDANSPIATPITVAAKLTGRTDAGLSVSALEAVTRRAEGAEGRTIEPLTSYAAVRLTQEAAGGRSALGAMATAVDRSLDASTAPLLRRDAYVGAVEFRHRFGGGPYGVTASATESVVGGSAAAIAATQRAPTHLYQRVGGALVFDSLRTSLRGDAQEIAFGKYEGALQFLTAWQRHSAGLEVDDLGFLERSDLQTLSASASSAVRQPHGMFRYETATLTWARQWNTAWLPFGDDLSAFLETLFTSNWTLDVAANVSQLGRSFCDHCARGGPALRQDGAFAPSISVLGDRRKPIVPSLSVAATTKDQGRSRSTTIAPGVTLQITPRVQASIGASAARNRDDLQWFGNFTDSTGQSHYAFARLEQRTVSLTARASVAATPNLTFETYASPFVSSGTYTNLRQLGANPRAMEYDDRFAAYQAPPSAATGFDTRQLRADVVARWEYRTGSTVFLVWTHGRDASGAAAAGMPLRDDYRRLFAAHPENTFVVKVSYWLNR